MKAVTQNKIDMKDNVIVFFDEYEMSFNITMKEWDKIEKNYQDISGGYSVHFYDKSTSHWNWEVKNELNELITKIK
mgnify:CR=1 FL=1